MKVITTLKLLTWMCGSFFLMACGGGSSSNSPSINNDVAPIIQQSEAAPGGDASRDNFSDDAFSFTPRAIEQDFSDDANFKAGNLLFRTTNNGHGPIVNSDTCQSCHIKDGRGRPPLSDNEQPQSMVLAINQDPTYGSQLQPFGIASFTGAGINAGIAQFNGGGADAIGEARVSIAYETLTHTYDDGSTVDLRKPTVLLSELAYGDFASSTRFSSRIAPQMIGLGLLEAVAASDITANASNNTSSDISGTARMVDDFVGGGEVLGRFGLKAAQASVLNQLTRAYQNDLGITSSLATDEPCTSAQASCIFAANQEADAAPGLVDIGDAELALVEFYSRLLAVPLNRAFDTNSQQFDEQFLAGREQFYRLECQSCHTPNWQTGEAKGSVLGEVVLGLLVGAADPIEVLSNQTIWPYTDMVLHDMGGQCTDLQPLRANGEACPSGENCIWTMSCEGLASGFDEGVVAASEWRTPPLWGIGLAQTVNPDVGFLHDGRARTIEEAILWHGGEAATAQQAFSALPASDRADVLKFLESI